VEGGERNSEGGERTGDARPTKEGPRKTATLALKESTVELKSKVGEKRGASLSGQKKQQPVVPLDESALAFWEKLGF